MNRRLLVRGTWIGVVGVVLSATVSLVAGCSTVPEELGSAESALEDKCTTLDIMSTCIMNTTWVKNVDVDPMNTVPGTAPPAGPGQCTFNCSNFAGNFCRCAEKLCPGKVGDLIFQSSVRCTAAYDCNAAPVTIRHALNIICTPSPTDPTKKSCKCVEPQGARPWVYKGSDRELGINETPPADFCTLPVCDHFFGGKRDNYKVCPGNDTHASCNNTNKADACPATCCVKPDGSKAEYCNECKPGSLKLCGAETALTDDTWCKDPKTGGTIKKPDAFCSDNGVGIPHKWNGWYCDGANRQWVCAGKPAVSFDTTGVYVPPPEPFDINNF